MKQRFRAREMWLIVPFLLIIAAALYWGRVEQVSKPGASEMFVSSCEFGSAPGYWQDQGYSHEVKIKVSHPWPRPKWWGEQVNGSYNLFPVNFKKPNFLPIGPVNDRWSQGGGALIVNRNGKQWPWRSRGFDISFDRGFDGTNYTFRHLIKKSAAFEEPGEITFRGLYRIELGQPFSVTHLVRKQGEILPPPIPHAANVQIRRVKLGSFLSSTGPNQSNVIVREDVAQVHVVFRRIPSQPKIADKMLTRIYDVEIVDEEGKVYRSSQRGEFRFQELQFSATENRLRKQLAPDEDVASINAFLDPYFRPKHKLKLRGKISVDEGWPLRFETALTPKS